MRAIHLLGPLSANVKKAYARRSAFAVRVDGWGAAFFSSPFSPSRRVGTCFWKPLRSMRRGRTEKQPSRLATFIIQEGFPIPGPTRNVPMDALYAGAFPELQPGEFLVTAPLVTALRRITCFRSRMGWSARSSTAGRISKPPIVRIISASPTPTRTTCFLVIGFMAAPAQCLSFQPIMYTTGDTAPQPPQTEPGEKSSRLLPVRRPSPAMQHVL